MKQQEILASHEAVKGTCPPRELCVLRYVLERQARNHPQQDFLRLADGSAFSYCAFLEMVQATAAGLSALGVRQGDAVNVWLPNGLEMVRVWFAINWLGAVYVPINVAYKGGVLEHVLSNGGAKVMVASVDLVPRLADVSCADLKHVVTVGGAAQSVIYPLQFSLIESVHCADKDAVPELVRPIDPWDVQSIIYTSGTTGRSKGVISSYAHLFSMSGTDAFYMQEEHDCFLLYGPLFHVGGTLPVIGSLNRGATVAIGGDFSTDSFWSTVRATRATLVILLGVMSSFLEKQSPSTEDKAHTLRKAVMIPLPESWPSFAERFGVDVWTLFNMTEINVPIVSEKNPSVLACGRLRQGMQARIVDENDQELPDGQVGELVLRSETPWSLNSGYFKDAENTAKAWRNGWFHTGDGFRRDAAGYYYFADRMKDTIRRRGENISSFEVEVEILAHEKVRECAVIAVPNETAEDDVLAVVALVPGQMLEPQALISFLENRLAHFMVPRYIRVLEALPRTPTQKVEKHVLRSTGLTDDTWDRDAAGIRIKRQKIRG